MMIVKGRDMRFEGFDSLDGFCADSCGNLDGLARASCVRGCRLVEAEGWATAHGNRTRATANDVLGLAQTIALDPGWDAVESAVLDLRAPDARLLIESQRGWDAGSETYETIISWDLTTESSDYSGESFQRGRSMKECIGDALQWATRTLVAEGGADDGE